MIHRSQTLRPIHWLMMIIMVTTLLWSGPAQGQEPSLTEQFDAAVTLQQQKKDRAAIEKLNHMLTQMAPDDMNKGLVYATIALSHLNLEELKQGRQAYEQAVPLLKIHPGENSRALGSAYMNLGYIAHSQKRYEAAIRYNEKAMAVFQTHQDNTEVQGSITHLYNNLGNAARSLKQYPEALAYYQNGLTSYRKLKTANHPMPQLVEARLLEGIGLSQVYTDSPQTALKTLKNSLAVYTQTLGKTHEETKTLKDVIELIEQRETQRSTVDSSALSSGSATKPVDPDSISGLYQQAEKAWDEQRWDEAESLFRQILAKTQGRSFSAEFMASLNASLGTVLHLQDRHAEAEPFLIEATNSLEAIKGSEDDFVANLKLVLGKNYFLQKKYPIAEDLLAQYLDHLTEKNGLYAELTKTYALTLYYQGKFDEAKPYFEEAQSVYRTVSGPDDIQVKSLQVTLDELQKLQSSAAYGQDHYFLNFMGDIYRWRDDTQEIWVHIEPGSTLSGWNDAYAKLAIEAFLEWQQALNDRFQFVYTDNPERSDVVVKWSERPVDNGDTTHQVGHNAKRTKNYFFVEQTITVALADTYDLRKPHEIRATLLHEIGHALGLGHSNNPADIMAAYADYKSEVVTEPHLTPRDIRTARILYQLQPKYTNPQGITVSEYRRFNEQLADARKAFNKGKYKKAYKLYQTAHTLYKHDPYTNYFFALSAIETKKFFEAIELLNTVHFPIHDNRFSVDKYLGYAYIELGHKYKKITFRKRKKKKQKKGEGGAHAQDYYQLGIQHLYQALNNPNLSGTQRRAIESKIQEGVKRRRPFTGQYQYPVYIRVR